jgi:hypothetical protein
MRNEFGGGGGGGEESISGRGGSGLFMLMSCGMSMICMGLGGKKLLI